MSAVINSAVDEVLSLCKEPEPNNAEQSKTVGCIVNHVGTAVKVADTLKKREPQRQTLLWGVCDRLI